MAELVGYLPREPRRLIEPANSATACVQWHRDDDRPGPSVVLPMPPGARHRPDEPTAGGGIGVELETAHQRSAGAAEAQRRHQESQVAELAMVAVAPCSGSQHGFAAARAASCRTALKTRPTDGAEALGASPAARADRWQQQVESRSLQFAQRPPQSSPASVHAKVDRATALRSENPGLAAGRGRPAQPSRA